MTEFLLIRHAVNEYVKTGKLAGWTPGVHLNDEGRAQAVALGQRLASTKIDALYASPLERTVETAQAVLEHHPDLTLQLLEQVGEVRYGDWQGAELNKLYRRKQWLMVQAFPSRMRFPNGEAMRHAQMRAVDALEMLAQRHPRSRVAVVFHADIIKLVLAYYLGVPIDLFQRINVSPASLSIISIGYGRIGVNLINETSYLPQPKKADGSVTELRKIGGLTVDALGEPGNRVFYLQVHHDGDKQTTLHIEKTQALFIADEIGRLLPPEGQVNELADNLMPELINPEPALFRGGKIELQYEEQTDSPDLIRMEIVELLGEGQGTPRLLRVWATRHQMLALGQRARALVQRGRSDDTKSDS
ncbi:MAG: MSMEG_4193 family putative phosphomutase [Anaerolineae bacterium]|nr:MSMEG_4193 family putative phosphomutase [Anaerolineae bacterium]